MGYIFVILLLLHEHNSSLSPPHRYPSLSHRTTPSTVMKLSGQFSRRRHPFDF